jgi:hypothetical protein
MCYVIIQWKHLCTAGHALVDVEIDMDMNITMDIHEKFVDMDVKYHCQWL